MSVNDHKDVLINGKTPEEIKTALRMCTQMVPPTSCRECPYKDGACLEHPPEADALALIERLEGEHSGSLAVHAEWIRDDIGNTRCSNCHTRLPFLHCYDDEDGYEWDDEIDETPWCMHCGARMDGDE